MFFVVKYLAFLSGCLSCFMLHSYWAVPLVPAAAATGLIGSVIPFPKRFAGHPNAAVYAGSFAGMCSAELISGYWQLAVIAFIGTTLYALTMNLFTGFGGKLGSVAFVSVALFMLVQGGVG